MTDTRTILWIIMIINQDSSWIIIHIKIMHIHENYTDFNALKLASENGVHIVTVPSDFLNKTQCVNVPIVMHSKSSFTGAAAPYMALQ